uniref:R13L1/DRL21-like LRR repeat region domain-containing protein n=1 Tax=Oryza brachyantha TaxID=4533 RepID=J3M1I6_ORYBR
MNSVQNLLSPYHLRYLEFIDVYKGGVVPQAFTSFYHLQVLNLSTHGVHDVPAAMSNLVNLRHFIAQEKVHQAIAGVGNMASLQELKFKVRNVCTFEMGQLQPMNKLVTLGISHLENVKTKDEASSARLIDKEYLKKLSLSWNGDSVSIEPDRSKDVLEGLRPHHNLKDLSITGYSSPNSPTWFSSNMSVTSLQTIHLENCREWQILSSLEMLPLLKKLKLVRMLNLMELSLPSLEELVLIEMPKLEKCIGSCGIELTTDLRVLMIEDCPQPNDFTPFQSYSSFGAELWFPSLRELTIVCCPHISKWETLPLGKMHALKSLKLTDLHAVRELLVPSLEKLVLSNMPSLECCSGLTASRVQMSTSQEDKEWLSGLRELTIHDCPHLVVSYALPPSALMSHFSIKGVPTHPIMEKHYGFTIKSDELIMLDDKILAFHSLRGIRSLFINDCPNLASLSNECLNQLIDLEGLCIRGCPNFTMTSGLVLPSLRWLSVQTCGISGSWLMEMLSHARSFDQLQLHDSPQIKFISFSQPTEMEGTCSLGSATTVTSHFAGDEQLLQIPSNVVRSLRMLVIFNCHNLEFSGEEGPLRGYTSLDIRIQHCPKLVPLLVSGMMEVGSLPTSLRLLDIDMGPELSTIWDLKLQELEQGGYQVPPPPPSLETFLVTNLTDKVQSCLLSCLPSITKLVISNSPELTSLHLGYSKALECLEIVGCESLASVEGFGSLTNLRSLVVYDPPILPRCFELLSHQQGATDIWSKLEKLQIGDGSVLTASLCKQLTSLKRLFFFPERSKHGAMMMGLTKEQERALQLLTSLQSLNFWHLPNLLSLPAKLASLTSLQHLYISNCPRIARLPEIGLPPSLVQLTVRRCSEELCMHCRMATSEKLKILIDDIPVD